ncbi:coiled-coil domain-containing protein 18 isoform X1 [Carcharodon carcharias]|uniref:coiled-coil domain-containing protein 18 isoform X1 n=1 Tax=Carcharodon carcharias TaxID=13397 RepID=UPI001B7F228D|nr:coiled-coil domain-containing protein 18 isoform X1 [Carcharodon carcharias]
MLAGAKDNPCRKFQANIFNKSKCQNCFKPREVHLLTDEDLNQAKPIYGGWLCLAPEGTDFENPMQRSRKWQRRFFVLYEHGCLRYALDESPSTLPQGTVNMNQCTDVIDAEPKTGQKNALCIITPEREFFIRGESKEIINGWFEQLMIYPRTNKQNQKKKRKVEPTTAQEPGPAKVAVTGSGIPDPEKIPDSRSSLWQEELHGRDVEATQSWPLPDGGSQGGLFSLREGDVHPLDVVSDHSSVNGDEVDRGRMLPLDQQKQEMRVLSPASSSSSRHGMEPGGIPRCPSPVYSDPFPSASSLLSNGSHISGSMSSLDSEASGSTVTSTDSHHAEAMTNRADRPRANREFYEAELRKVGKRTRIRSPERSEAEQAVGQEGRRSTVIEKFEALELDADQMEADESTHGDSRPGRSETRRVQRREGMKKESIREQRFHSSAVPPLRRAKSLDRRTTESIMTPDLLNFKKGWMVKLDEMGQWKKYWFVLTDHSLRYYKDSIAEDASDLDGEIDLSTCYNVTEYQVQRNYGFQIHTQEALFTLSAMTAGIRRNWMQALMKNIRPSTAPDVASLPEEQCAVMLPDTTPRYDSKSDSPSSETSSVDKETGQRKSRARERRREGRSKTFDWAEFRPIAQALAQERAAKADLCDSHLERFGSPPSDLNDWERTKRREERRKRYEAVTGTVGSSSADANRMEFEPSSSSPLLDRRQKVHDEIEEHWQQVERTPIREERRIPLATVLPSSQTSQMDKLLETHTKELEELKTQLEHCQQELIDTQKYRAELEAQLKASMEREQQIRSGYISQLEPPLASSNAWQQLQKLNQDLQAELEVQQQKQEGVNAQAQSLKKSYQDAKELLRQQETKMQNLQAKLDISLSEVAINEQSLSKTQNDLHLERQKYKEQADEYERKLSMFSNKLRESEEKLREVEGLLLEKTQAFRDLERQVALQDDYQREVKRLQEHLEETSNRLRNSEQGVILSEERFQKQYESLKEKYEKEKEILSHSVQEAEEKVREYEDRLQTLEAQLERAQKEKLAISFKSSEMVRQMEEHVEKSEGTVKKLTHDIDILSAENKQLNQRYQEIVNQLTEADREVEGLKLELMKERDGYQDLNEDFEKAIQEMNRLKNEVEEANFKFVSVKESYERELEKKNKDFNEALIKLEALGTSLEETEKKLQLKEATLKGLGWQVPTDIDMLIEKKELQIKLEDAEARLAEQEMKLQTTENNYKELLSQNSKLQSDLEISGKNNGHVARKTLLSCSAVENILHSTTSWSEPEEGQSSLSFVAQLSKELMARLQLLDSQLATLTGSVAHTCAESRFSGLPSSVNTESSYGITVADSYFTDLKNCLAIVCTLETKLLIVEQNIKGETVCSLGIPASLQCDAKSLGRLLEPGVHLKEQGKVNQPLTCSLSEQLASSNIKHKILVQATNSEFQVLQTKLLQLHHVLEGIQQKTGQLAQGWDMEQHRQVSELVHALGNSVQYLQHMEEDLARRNRAFFGEEILVKDFLTEEEKLKHLVDKLALEAAALSNIADALQNSDSGVKSTLDEIRKHSESIVIPLVSLEEVNTQIGHYVLNKLLIEGEFWANLPMINESKTPDVEEQLNEPMKSYLNMMANSTLIKGEMMFWAHNILEVSEEKLQQLKAQYMKKHHRNQNLEQMLRNVIAAYGTCRFGGLIEEIRSELNNDEEGESFLLCSQSLKLPSASVSAGQDFELRVRTELAQQIRKNAYVLKKMSHSIQSCADDDLGLLARRLIHSMDCIPALSRYSNAKDIWPFLLQDAVVQAELSYVISKIQLKHDLRQSEDIQLRLKALEMEHSNSIASLQSKHAAELKKQKQEQDLELKKLKGEIAEFKKMDISPGIGARTTHIQIEGEPIDSLDKAIELQDMAARHKKELREVREAYEVEVEKLKREIARAGETLKLKTEENVKEIDSLTVCMENLKEKHVEELRRQGEEFKMEKRELEQRCARVKEELSQEIEALKELDIVSDLQRSTDQYRKTASEPSSVALLRNRIQELESQIDAMKNKSEAGPTALREKYEKDLENLKATCERGFSAMEESHQKVIEELHRQHQRELENLQEDKERLLAEETAATISAIEAMKNAHRLELDRELERIRKSQSSNVNADLDEICKQHDEELASLQREIEVLSEQYSQKCLENAHLAQALEAERQALRQCQRENQELNAHNQELNNRLATEITRLRTMMTSDSGGDVTGLSQGKEVYELEVLLRVKESEIQYLKQEINSLKDELQTAQRDKKYATDKYKDIYTELSIVKAKSERDVNRLKEQLQLAQEALGEQPMDETEHSRYDIMKSKSNPDILKMAAAAKRADRTLRSKSLKEGLTVQQRFHLFENKETKEF